MRALSDAILNAGPMEVRATLMSLAELVCRDPRLAGRLASEALSASERGNQRLAADILYAMGRCKNSEVLEHLIRVLRDEDAPAPLRGAAAIGLAQRRVIDLRYRAGRVGIAFGDTHLDGPIEEAFVREAILETLVTMFRDRNISKEHSGHTLYQLIHALGGSATVDHGVFSTLEEIGDAAPSYTPWVLSAFQLSLGSSQAAYARAILFRPDADDATLQAAMSLLIRSDLKGAAAIAASLLAARSGSDAVALLTAMGTIGVVEEGEMHAVEALCQAAVEWARQHPTVRLEDQTEVSTGSALQGVLSVALARGASESRVIVGYCANALLERLESDNLSSDRELAIAVQTCVSLGRSQFIDEFVSRLRGSTLNSERLAHTILSIRQGTSRKRWEKFEARILSLLDRLPPELMKRTEKALGEFPDPRK